MIYKSHRATSSSYPSVLIQSWMEWIDDPVSIRMYPPCSRSCRNGEIPNSTNEEGRILRCQVGTCKNWDERINITVCLSMSFTYFESDLTVPIMALWMLSAVLGHIRAHHENSKVWPAQGVVETHRWGYRPKPKPSVSFWFQRASPWKSQKTNAEDDTVAARLLVVVSWCAVTRSPTIDEE